MKCGRAEAGNGIVSRGTGKLCHGFFCFGDVGSRCPGFGGNKIMDEKERNLGLIEGGVSSVLNTGLFALKLWVGISIGSIAMLADAWHTLSDTLTSLVVIAGFWLSARPKDQKHPYGHGRAEVIGALVLGLLLGMVGLIFLKDSLVKLWCEEPPPIFTGFAIAVFAISALLKEALAQFSFWAGKRINSLALIGDGWHHRSDAIASLLIVAGAIFGGSLWWIDAALGAAVSLLIIRVSVRVVRDAANELLGEELDERLKNRICEIVFQIAPGVSVVHHLHQHRYGNHREVTLHVQMAGATSLNQAHEISSQIENRLRRELGIEATVHPEPCTICNQGDDEACVKGGALQQP